MNYPAKYRGVTRARAGVGNHARAALAFERALTAPRPPAALVSPRTASILAFPTLARYGTRAAIGKLAIRLLLGKALGPVGIILDIWELYQATKPALGVRPDMTGWGSVWEDCGRSPAFGPYPNNPLGCTNANSAVAESSVGSIENHANYYGCWFMGPTKANGQASTVTTGTRLSLKANSWRVFKPATQPAIPVWLPAQSPVPMVISEPNPWGLPSLGALPRPVKDALAEWPQAYESVEPDSVARWHPAARPNVNPYAVPNFSYGYEVEIAPQAIPSARPRVRPRVRPRTRPHPWVRPEPRTDPKAKPEPKVEPKIVPIPRGRISTRTRLDPRPKLYVAARPRGPIRELKSRARAGYGLIMAAIGAGTETLDLIDALYKSLPERFKIKGKSRFLSRLKVLMEHWREINPGRGLEEIFWNQVEDMLFGRIGRFQASSVRRLSEQGLWGGPFGTTVGGSNRQDVTRINGVKVPSPTDQLRTLMEPYYRKYIPRE